MRTTMTLEADVIQKLKAYSHKSGKSFKMAVNELLRLGLQIKAQAKPAIHKFSPPLYRSKAGLQPGFSWEMSHAEMQDKLDE